MTAAPRSAFTLGLPFFALAVLTVSACATEGPRQRDKTLEQLTAECEARGGVLVPTGRVTGRDALDNVCRITGGPSQRLRGG